MNFLQEARETTVPMHGIFYGILESLGGLGYTLSFFLSEYGFSLKLR